MRGWVGKEARKWRGDNVSVGRHRGKMDQRKGRMW